MCLSLFPLALVWFPGLSLLCLCFSVLSAFRPAVPGGRAHIPASGLHPHIKLFGPAPVRERPRNAGLPRLGPPSQGSGQRASMGIGRPQLNHMAGEEEGGLSTWGPLGRLFPRIWELWADSTANDNDKSKLYCSHLAGLSCSPFKARLVGMRCNTVGNVYAERIDEEKQKSQLDEHSSARARNKNPPVKTK